MSLFKTFRVEIYKFCKGKIWPILLISPLLCGLMAYFYSQAEWAEDSGWLDIYGNMVAMHGMYLLPLLTGLVVAMICRYEHLHGGWKQYLAQPVRRWQVYVVKFILAAGAIAVVQMLIFAALFGAGTLAGMEGSIPVDPIVTSLFGGWLATFPLLALQLWVTTAWSSFAAPMALNVIFTMPAVLIVASEQFGPYYPWAQPLLAMAVPSEGMDDLTFLSTETLLIVVLGGFLAFFVGGLSFFQKRAY